jgi:membrane protein DedA with SNARE-associated domain
MKTSLGTILVTLFLASLVWLFFHRMTPDAPLSSKEMVFVVIGSLLLILLVQFIWKHFRKERTK